MATRAATFNSKIRSLKDYHSRITRNTTPQPSGLDIAGTLKYFSVSLIGVLKDVPLSTESLFHPSTPSSIFPDLDYSLLFEKLQVTIEIMPLVQSNTHALGESILSVLSCLAPFLPTRLSSSLPHLLSTSLPLFPPSLHRELIMILCLNLLPLTLENNGKSDDSGFCQDSTPSILLMIFQFTTSKEYHSMIVESLMSLKRDVYKDLLQVIAYGTTEARASAAHLFFYYYPQINPLKMLHKDMHGSYHGFDFCARSTILCQRSKCMHNRCVAAIKSCMDPRLIPDTTSIPIHLCQSCVDDLDDGVAKKLDPVVRRIEKMEMHCEDKTCSGLVRDGLTLKSTSLSVCTCFSSSCILSNDNRPVRLCMECHLKRHGKKETTNKNPKLSRKFMKNRKKYPQSRFTEGTKDDKKQEEEKVQNSAVQGNTGVNNKNIKLKFFGERSNFTVENKTVENGVKSINKSFGNDNVAYDDNINLNINQKNSTTNNNINNAFNNNKNNNNKNDDDDEDDGSTHIYQLSPPTLNEASDDVKIIVVDAIVSLLKEVDGLKEKRMVEMGDVITKGFVGGGTTKQHNIISRYGVWLLVQLVPPNQKDLPFEMVGKLLTALFHWYDMTTYLKDDIVGNSLNRLKPKYLKEWVIEISRNYGDVMTSCLLPFPPEIFQVSIEEYSNERSRLKDSLNTFLCLLPYNLVSAPMWTYLLCFWLEAIRVKVEWEKIGEFKILLRKLFDNSLGVSGLNDVEKWQFIYVRMSSSSCHVQKQTLLWLQILTSAGVDIDVDILVESFIGSLDALTTSYNNNNNNNNNDNNKNNNDDDNNQDNNNENQDDNNKINNNMDENKKNNENRSNEKDGRYKNFKIGDKEKSRSEDDEEDDDDVEKADSKDEEKNEKESDTCMQCFILMLDVLIKQLELRETPRNKGLFAPTNQRILTLLSKTNQFILLAHSRTDHPMIDEGLSNQLNTSQPNVFFMNTLDELDCRYFKLVLQLVEFIVPSIKPEFPVFEFNSSRSLVPTFEEVDLNGLVSQLPRQFHFCYSLVQFLVKSSDPSIHLPLLTSLSLLIQHTNLLYHLTHPHEKIFLCQILKELLIPCLWELLPTKHNQLNSETVSLLLYSLTLPPGDKIFDEIVERDFTCRNVSVRFLAVEKICILTCWLDFNKVSSNHLVQSSLAHSFIHLTSTLQDTSSSVVIQTSLLLKSLSFNALKCIRFTLERHFDLISRDRNLVIDNLTQLSDLLATSVIRPDFLTWSFFFDRLDFLCLEGQILLQASGDISHLQDLHHSDLLSKYFLQKVSRARLALKISETNRKGLKKSKFNRKEEDGYNIENIVYKEFGSCAYVRFENTTQSHKFSKELFDQLYNNKESRPPQQPQLQFRPSRFGASLFANFPACGNVREFTDNENSHHTMVMKTATVGGTQQSTVLHRVITALMKFMIDVEQKEESKKIQDDVINHVSTLIGYNCNDKSFMVPPYKMRCSVVFNAFISGLPKVLDMNFPLGNEMLHFCVDLLQYAPSPQRYASDFQPPNYSLWYLEPHIRVSWLQSLLVILYKYSYSKIESIIRLIKIIINTIASRSHQCRAKETTHPTSSPFIQRNRDTSRVSVQDLDDIVEDDEVSTNSSEEDDDEDENDDEREKAEKEIFKDTKLSGSKSFEFGNFSVKFTQQRKGVISDSQSSLRMNPNVPCLQKLSGPSGFKFLKKSDNVSEEDQAKRIAEYKKWYPTVESFSSLSKKSFSLKGKSFDEKYSIQDALIEEEEEEDDEEEIDNSNEIVVDENGINEKTKNDKKMRKSGLSMIKMVKELDLNEKDEEDGEEDEEEDDDELFRQKEKKDHKNKNKSSKNGNSKSGKGSTGEKQPNHVISDTCLKCGAVLEYFDEEIINIAIVCLATFVHREPVMASPLLPSMLLCVVRVASSSPFLWKTEQGSTKLVTSGESGCTARQFIRCVLHQLAPNNIFPQLFIATAWGDSFMEVIVSTLMDFPELNCVKALQITLEGINNIYSITSNQLDNTICNLASFLSFMPVENPQWTAILTHFDIFFRKVSLILTPSYPLINPLFKIIISLLKLPNFSNRTILEPFSKIISLGIQSCSFDLQLLIDICSLCGRTFTKERDKFCLTRCVELELVQALRFKQSLPDENFILLVQMVCLDAGGTLGTVSIARELASYSFNPHNQSLVSSNIADLFRHHLPECIEFVADIHTSNKLKTSIRGVNQNLNEDTLGSHLKVAISQYIALELTHSNAKDTKLLARHFPWLLHPPSSIEQGNPREFIDCICHIRVMCWLLLGSLVHTSVTKAAGSVVCRPLPLKCSACVSDQVMVILTGFSVQDKNSVLLMSSLYYAFILCQLWTVYCELQETLEIHDAGDDESCHHTILLFWNKVTPGILHLLSHSKAVSEKVIVHLLSLIEALQECHSTVLVKLFSLWGPILRSCHSQLSGNTRVRLQKCENWKPSVSGSQLSFDLLFKWVRRSQFKLAQNEVQSSNASQFYTV